MDLLVLSEHEVSLVQLFVQIKVLVLVLVPKNAAKITEIARNCAYIAGKVREIADFAKSPL